jgi:hypothetical protein
MKNLVLFVLLCICAFCSIGLPDVDDTSLGALLSGNWQALLPEDIQTTRNQLLKLLTPAPTTAPQHMASSHRHYRLASNDLTF